jgi:DNA-binding transcriptional ArsR family regulator
MLRSIMADPTPQRPEPEYVVNDLDTLRVLADPLRLQIIELLTPAPRTVKQIAADLKLHATKLYYHIKQLEERGLIRVVDTRIVSGILEKHYQAVALSYRVDKSLFSPKSPAGQESLDVMLNGLFEDTKDDIRKSIEAESIDLLAQEGAGKPLHRSLLIARNTLHLSPEKSEEFYRRLNALIREYTRHAGQAEDPAEQVYGLLIALYPSTRAPHPLPDQQG